MICEFNFFMIYNIFYKKLKIYTYCRSYIYNIYYNSSLKLNQRNMASFKPCDLINAIDFRESIQHIQNLGIYADGYDLPFGITHTPIGVNFASFSSSINLNLFNCESVNFIDRYDGRNEKYPINTQYNLHDSKFVKSISLSHIPLQNQNIPLQNQNIPLQNQNNMREINIAKSILRNLMMIGSQNIVCCYKVSNIQYECLLQILYDYKLNNKIVIYRTTLLEGEANNHSGMIIYRKDQFMEVEFSREEIGFKAKKYYFAQKISLYPIGHDIFDAVCFVNTHLPVDGKNDFIDFINKIRDYPVVFAGNLNHPSKTQLNPEINTIDNFQDTQLKFFRPTKFTGLNILMNVLDSDELVKFNDIIKKQNNQNSLTNDEEKFVRGIFNKQLDVFDVIGVIGL